MNVIQTIENALESSARYLPLEVFSFWGGFVEEVIAPIPSPLVMTAVGSAAFAQSKEFQFLMVLALLGSAGKTLGAWLFYYAADKFEDVLIGKYGRYIGVSHKEVEGIGSHFKGGWKDDLILILLRALPIVPSAPVSMVCGFIKINLRTYLVSTFLGNAIRNMLYIYLGFAGVSAYQSLIGGFDSLESIVQILMFLGVAGFLGWVVYQRKNRPQLKAAQTDNPLQNRQI